jgi:hypothetical protein
VRGTKREGEKERKTELTVYSNQMREILRTKHCNEGRPSKKEKHNKCSIIVQRTRISCKSCEEKSEREREDLVSDDDVST